MSKADEVERLLRCVVNYDGVAFSVGCVANAKWTHTEAGLVAEIVDNENVIMQWNDGSRGRWHINDLR